MATHNISYRLGMEHLTVDIELTNKCNLKCSFCPRENIPKTGLMTLPTFKQVIARIKESNLLFTPLSCGTGDSILHPEIENFIAYARSQQLPYRLTTSATLLNAEKSRRLLEAGLSEIHISVTDINERYSKNYGFPFEKTLENIHRFKEISGDKYDCKIKIVIVLTTDVFENIDGIFAFWEKKGFKKSAILLLEEHNRAGSYLKNQQEDYKIQEIIQTDNNKQTIIRPRCPVPYVSIFIGWDGNYYLCSHDWEKQALIGNVYEHSFSDATERKLQYMKNSNSICYRCSVYPENYLADIDNKNNKIPRQSRNNFVSNQVHHEYLISNISMEMSGNE